MKKLIESNSEFIVVKDMSKGSKREDIQAYNLSISIDTLKEILEDEEKISEFIDGEIIDDDHFSEYLNLV